MWFCRVSLCHLLIKVPKNSVFYFLLCVSAYNKSFFFFFVIDEFLIVISPHMTHVLNR